MSRAENTLKKCQGSLRISKKMRADDYISQLMKDGRVTASEFDEILKGYLAVNLLTYTDYLVFTRNYKMKEEV